MGVTPQPTIEDHVRPPRTRGVALQCQHYVNVVDRHKGGDFLENVWIFMSLKY